MSDPAETLCVLALDAADYRLAREWDCENILLDTHDELETFSYSKASPVTLEVWTSVATGVHPRVHGIASTGEQQEWENPILRAANRVAPHVLPKDLRIKLGTMLRGDDDDSVMTFGTTDHDHFFPEGGAYCWPGVTPAKHLAETWHWLNLAEQGDIPNDELWRRLYGNMGREFGWLMAMSETTLPVVGVHSHVLDAAGHAYARRPERLREVYEDVDEMLARVREHVDRLVVLSDHGIEVGWVEEDDSPGSHSWRAMVGTTEEGPLPESVLDVREWVEERTGDESAALDDASLDTTRDQLKDLGYL